jgi:hypothetical protein
VTLYAAANRKNLIHVVPHRLLLSGWKNRLQTLELRAISFEFDRLIEIKKGREICTANWLSRELSPHGRVRWDNSPLQHIWEKACQRDHRQTCWCFGLLLWEHMMSRSDAWRVERADLDEVPIAGTTYFRCRSSEEPKSSRKMAQSMT